MSKVDERFKTVETFLTYLAQAPFQDLVDFVYENLPKGVEIPSKEETEKALRDGFIYGFRLCYDNIPKKDKGVEVLGEVIKQRRKKNKERF